MIAIPSSKGRPGGPSWDHLEDKVAIGISWDDFVFAFQHAMAQYAAASRSLGRLPHPESDDSAALHLTLGK